MNNTVEARVDTRYFRTTNRVLEQFLWMHKVKFRGQMKMDDGLNAWVYEKTPKFIRVLQEFQELQDEPLTY